jgi:hypothetical protein
MINYFLLGEKKPYSNDKDLLVNILDRLSLSEEEYKIGYCYNFTPPSRKDERKPFIIERHNQLILELNPETIITAMGWMAIEVISDISKTHISQYIGCRFTINPFKYDVWFTYDPAAALFDPNLYVDIMGCVSAAIRSAGKQIKINTCVKPYQWTNPIR